jgi:Aminopeptidase I zinc metalloprotease (M18)
MNAGMVIKRNSNQRYATTSVSGVLIREVARRASLPPVQEFVIRQDCGCGSTIGPLIATATGIRAIDMGCPQLSMHSIREQMGICDCKYSSIVTATPMLVGMTFFNGVWIASEVLTYSPVPPVPYFSRLLLVDSDPCSSAV